VIGVKETNVTSWPESSRFPATRERTRSRRARLPVPWCETHRGLQSAELRAPLGGGRRRGTDAPVIADPARPAGQPAARAGRPGLCARRSDRRGSSILRFRARCALLARTGVPQPSQRPPR